MLDVGVGAEAVLVGGERDEGQPDEPEPGTVGLRPGGEVAIATEATAERVRVRVSETGCGIAPDRIAAIFDDFVTTKRRGLGLGLAISKKIVEQLGGQISVTSEVGKGTTFVLDFPRVKARPIALAAG